MAVVAALGNEFSTSASPTFINVDMEMEYADGNANTAVTSLVMCGLDFMVIK